MRTTRGHFYKIGVLHKMKRHQQPLSVEDQIENLKAIGLTINDEAKAKELLNDISYYRIIKGYSFGLKDQNGVYIKGVSFFVFMRFTQGQMHSHLVVAALLICHVFFSFANLLLIECLLYTISLCLFQSENAAFVIHCAKVSFFKKSWSHF